MPGTVLNAGGSELTSKSKSQAGAIFFGGCQELIEGSQWRKRKRWVGETLVDTDECTVLKNLG